MSFLIKKETLPKDRKTCNPRRAISRMLYRHGCLPIEAEGKMSPNGGLATKARKPGQRGCAIRRVPHTSVRIVIQYEMAMLEPFSPDMPSLLSRSRTVALAMHAMSLDGLKC